VYVIILAKCPKKFFYDLLDTHRLIPEAIYFEFPETALQRHSAVIGYRELMHIGYGGSVCNASVTTQ
jgi:hypothetical protein